MDSFNSPWPSPSSAGLDGLDDDVLQHHQQHPLHGMDMVSELQDNAFEPQTRARSNTWPLPRPDNFIDSSGDCDPMNMGGMMTTQGSDSTQCSNQQLSNCVGGGAGGQLQQQQQQSQQQQQDGGVGGAAAAAAAAAQKKNSSRRNAWGNLSYADLITQAISSASESRLTLSQIYEWMVQNVPYFKDKGDSNSSAGWKNSIRHNLSLHNRFMRVQNEGTGKSSWWMLNPDAKPGKSVRRRAASMETSKYEKRRGRAKKRVEALKNAGLAGIAGLNDATPSPSSSISEGLDLFPESPLHSGGFQLSPDFRQRASSNASSCGRLSPIPAVVGLEPDWSFENEFQQTPPTNTSPSQESSSQSAAQSQALDQLASELADDLTLQNEYLKGFSSASSMHSQPPPPPPPYHPPQPYSLHAAQPYAIHSQCPIHRMQPCTCLHNTRESMSPSSGTGMSPSYPHSEASPDSMSGGGGGGVYSSSIMTPRPPSNSPPLTPTSQNPMHANDLNGPSTLMGQFMEVLNSQSDDLNIESFHGGLECDVDELIQQELNIDGLLDINIPMTSNHNTLAHHTATQSMTGSSGNGGGITTNTVGSMGGHQNQGSASHTIGQYPQQSVTPPSWVH